LDIHDIDIHELDIHELDIHDIDIHELDIHGIDIYGLPGIWLAFLEPRGGVGELPVWCSRKCVGEGLLELSRGGTRLYDCCTLQHVMASCLIITQLAIPEDNWILRILMEKVTTKSYELIIVSEKSQQRIISKSLAGIIY
jgi:hypothetical protein